MLIEPKLLAEIQARIRNKQFEPNEAGIYIPKGRLQIGGMFSVSVNDGPTELHTNILVTEGLNHLLDVLLHGATQTSTWYIAPFSGNVTPLATWTAANFTASATEFTAYDETTRQEYAEGAAAAGVTTNSTPAVFTCSTNGSTVRGAALISASAKSATTGKLLCASRFASDKALDDNDSLSIGYTLTATSA